MPGLPAPPDPSSLSDVERMNLPRACARSTSTRSASTPRSGCSSSGRRGPPGFAVTNENAPPSRRSRPGCTACRWRSSSRPPGSSCSPRTRSSPGSSTSSRCCLRADATCRSGSRRCAARSPGATTCSTTAQAALDRLSVFPGGWDLETAEAVCGPAAELGIDVLDGIEGARRPEPRPDRRGHRRRAARFVMLDTIREYAAERLEAAARPTRSPSGMRTDARPRGACGPQLSGAEQRDLARPAGARPRRHARSAGMGHRAARPGPVARGSGSRCGGSGRSTATSPRHDSGSRRWRPRGDARARLRGALRRGARGHLLLAGRSPGDAAVVRGGARDLAGLATRVSSRMPTTTTSMRHPAADGAQRLGP